MWKLQNVGHFYYYVFLLTFIIRIYIIYPRIMDKESWEKKTVVQLIFLIYLMGPTMQSIIFLVDNINLIAAYLLIQTRDFVVKFNCLSISAIIFMRKTPRLLYNKSNFRGGFFSRSFTVKLQNIMDISAHVSIRRMRSKNQSPRSVP